MELIKVTIAEYISDFKINFTFNDGLVGEIDFKDELYGEVFEPLKDVEVFKKFHLNPFTIEWECGADFSPEFLHGCINHYVNR